MTERSKRGFKEGVGFGLIAGIIFAMMEMAAAAMMGDPPLMPIQAFASIVLGESAFQTASLGSVVAIGAVVHLVLSAVFGAIYGLVNAGFSPTTETSWGRQVGLGLAFGAALWLVNFQIIARFLYPWFLEMSQVLQVIMHAVFFGLPLALMYAAAERRVQHVGRAHAPT